MAQGTIFNAYNGKESENKEYRYTYTCRTESLCCTVEINTIL